MPAGRTSLYFDLLDSFQQPGCPICRYALRAVERFFDALTYENTNDPAVRADVRAARGFCNRHSAQYLGHRDELGAAIIYRDLLHTIVPAVETALASGLAGLAGALTDPDGQRAAEQARRELAPDEVCPACRRLLEAEAHYLATLLQHLGSAEFAAAYEQSSGLCTVHLGPALHGLRGARAGAARGRLLGVQRRRWEELLRRLDGGAPDRPAWQEALAAAVGGTGVRP